MILTILNILEDLCFMVLGGILAVFVFFKVGEKKEIFTEEFYNLFYEDEEEQED